MPDLRVWKGDLHPVGTRGTTLSGGQRARQGMGKTTNYALLAGFDCFLAPKELKIHHTTRNSEDAKVLTYAMTLCVKCASARSLGSIDYQLYQL